MNNVELMLLKGKGMFYIREGEHTIAEMVFDKSDTSLTVYHTEVVPEAEGKGIAGELLTALVEYARQNHLKVVPLCPYVHAQFKRHPERYQDIWEQDR